MIIDGKEIANELIASMRRYVDERGLTPRMIALTAEPDAPTRQFLRIKTKVAERTGIQMETREVPVGASLDEVETVYADSLARAHGIVLQLPFPGYIPVQSLLEELPSDLDPDCLGVSAGELLRSGEHVILPPVVSAIRLIAIRYGIELQGKRAVVVGQGRLVGAPAAAWLEGEGADVTRLTKKDALDSVSDADIVVLGAGAPGIITQSMIKDGAVVIDFGFAGTEKGIAGDVDFEEVGKKASLITPVPGGVGPMTVATLMENTLLAQELRESAVT